MQQRLKADGTDRKTALAQCNVSALRDGLGDGRGQA